MEDVIKVRPENNQVVRYKAIIREYLTKEEVHDLMKKSDLLAAWEVFRVWFWILAAFALVYFWPNVFTVALALVVIGAKQLGCAIIMHDASHYSLFNSRRINDLVGNWLGAYPLVHNVRQYRPYHLQHHMATGTDEDPDINLTTGYPTSRASMGRKFGRDLSGVTGVKGYFGVFAMHFGMLKYNLGNYIERIAKGERGYMWQNGWKNLRGPLAANLIMFGICLLLGRPLLYLLWPASLLTTHMFIMRVRSIAEHSMVDDPGNPLRNARTLKANFIEQFLFAPLHVNYHLEHHLLFTVPCYRFKKMHALLRERGLYEKANYSKGYWRIIKMAASGKRAVA